MKGRIHIYDTTLRDGAQGEEVNFSAEDKIKIARKLDEVGVSYIEGGWPGSNPKDERFFRIVKGVTFKMQRLLPLGAPERHA